MDYNEDDECREVLFSPRGYDPVAVAASLHLRLPLNMMIHREQPSFNRRRLSLVEALNNSIQDDLTAPDSLSGAVTPERLLNPMSRSLLVRSESRMAPKIERIYSIRQILEQNNESLAARGRGSVKLPRFYASRADEDSQTVLQAPPRFRAKPKRSKSQPSSGSSNESDEDYDTGCSSCSPSSHSSQTDGGVAGMGGVGCRCSLHSTASSHASTSETGASSVDEGNGDRAKQGTLLAEATWDHVAMLPDELPFSAGDVITVLDCSSQTSLWYGSTRECHGWFPASHVTLIKNNNSTSRPISTATALSTDSFSPSQRKLRGKIVEELLNTERDYVQLLENVVQGFLEQTRRRSDLFPAERVRRIFGNVQSLYVLHCRLLRELEMSLDPRRPENSCVGAAFLRNQQHFSVYSEYCTHRPVSAAELARLEVPHSPHGQFLEACRLLRGMPRLPLDAFLLAPVQRICRYPLQLGELLKVTPESHDDRVALEAAERAMRAVAGEINDRKRRIEALQDMTMWQRSVHGWRGPDLIENNSSLIRSGEVSCRCMLQGQAAWTKDVLLFLFDESIVICKKDLLKKNFFVFKDRMSLHGATVVDCQDGRDETFGCSCKHAFKLVGSGRQYLFSCGDKKTKSAWMTALDRRTPIAPASAEEKRLALATLHSLH